MTNEELTAILAAHIVWVETEGRNGMRAKLEGADLYGANLYRANLRGANLYGANLESANLRGANLIDADLKDANLVRANLMDANLEGANLIDADLKDANLVRANLEGANLRGANLGGANLEGALGLVLPELKPKTALGRKAGVLGKLKKQALPMKAGAFKKLFPDEFEKIKTDTQGADFTPKLLESLVAKHGFTWGVVAGSYASSAQRICANANDVLMLVIDISDDAYTDEQRKQLRAVAQVSSRSGHPVAAGSNLFTVGWIRYCVFPDRILIEEVQSDVGGVRKGLKDSEFSASLLGSGINPEELDATMALVQPFADRFYEDAVALVFDMAAEEGKKVEMLDYAQKKEHGSPRNVYTDLPKSMGMKLGPSEAMSELGQVWTYTPNRRTRRR